MLCDLMAKIVPFLDKPHLGILKDLNSGIKVNLSDILGVDYKKLSFHVNTEITNLCQNNDT